MASQQSTGGGTACAPAADDEVTIITAGTYLGRSTFRTRFEPTIQDKGTEFISPLRAAQDHIKSATSTNLPGLQNLFREKGLKHLALAHKIHQKQRNITRITEDDAYVPVSARLYFNLQAWKTAEESTEFTDLVTETNAIVTNFHMELKAQIINNMILERDSIRVVMLNEICASIYSITELHLEALSKNPLLAHEMSLAIFQTKGTALLQHLPSATLDEFTALYRTVNTIPDTTTATATNVRTRETIIPELVSVLVTSWTIYLKQQRDNEPCLALRKKANESLASDATTEADILLDAEVPAT
jgi:hypothetical protein